MATQVCSRNHAKLKNITPVMATIHAKASGLSAGPAWIIDQRPRMGVKYPRKTCATPRASTR
jgi:hypothetical protein